MGKIAPEMLETEYETFDTLVCDVFFTCRFYFRQVFFVYDFVGLKVQKPVTGAVHFGKVGLLGIDDALGYLSVSQIVSTIFIFGMVACRVRTCSKVSSEESPTAITYSSTMSMTEAIDSAMG